MSACLSLCLYLCLPLSVCLCVLLSVSNFAFLCLYVCLSVCPRVSLFLSLSRSFPLRLCFYSICLCRGLSVFLPLCQSLSLSLSLSPSLSPSISLCLSLTLEPSYPSLPFVAFKTLTHSSWHVYVDVASRTIRLNTSLFWASLPASVGLISSHSLMSSVHLLVGRPFLLLPSSLASNMCFSRESCLYRWPKYDSFLALMLFNNQSWPTFSSFRISVLAFKKDKIILAEYFVFYPKAGRRNKGTKALVYWLFLTLLLFFFLFFCHPDFFFKLIPSPNVSLTNCTLY